MLLSIERGLEGIGPPCRVHHALAVDDLLIHIDLGITWIRGACVTLLMPTHPHYPRTSSSNVVCRKHQVDQCGLDEVVVVAPDDPFFIGVHGVGAVARGFWLVSPFGGQLELVD
ncbi:hypothetical protein D3C78_1473530 [compost metagenome]